MVDQRVYAKQQSAQRVSDDTWTNLRGSRDGAPICMPWQVALAIEGKVYQVRLGTITAPLTGDIEITTVAAEAASEAAAGHTILPLAINVEVEALGCTLPQACVKAVNALITTLGTAFVPLNLRIGGPAAAGRSAVAAAGGVAVASETQATTRVLASAHMSAIGDSQPQVINKQFKTPHVLVGPASMYLQVGTVMTGSDYFGFYNFAELLSNDIT